MMGLKSLLGAVVLLRRDRLKTSNPSYRSIYVRGRGLRVCETETVVCLCRCFSVCVFQCVCVLTQTKLVNGWRDTCLHPSEGVCWQSRCSVVFSL